MDITAPSNRDARRQRIVAMARTLFLRQGYAATSMSQIAARIGGSKTTLWSYFSSKPDLFIAVADDIVVEYFNPVLALLDDADELAEVLERAGVALLNACFSPGVMALMRIVSAEAGRFTELGALFHKRGLGHGWSSFAAYFERARLRGQIIADCDPMVVAQQFLALCEANSFRLVMLGGVDTPDVATIHCDVRAAVTTIIRAFAVHPSAVRSP